MIDYGAAIHSVKKSSKSELSSRFLGRLKFWAVRRKGGGGVTKCNFSGFSASAGRGRGGEMNSHTPDSKGSAKFSK